MRAIALSGNYQGIKDSVLGLLFFSTADPNGGRSAHLPALLRLLPECFFSPSRWAVEMAHSLQDSPLPVATKENTEVFITQMPAA